MAVGADAWVGAGTPIQVRWLALAAGCFTGGVAGAAVTLMLFSPQELQAVLPVACWLVYPVVGALILDARPADILGGLFSVLGTVPLVVAVYSGIWAGGQPTAQAAAAAAAGLTGPMAAALLVAVPVAALPQLPHARVHAVVAGVGASLTFAGMLVHDDSLSGLAVVTATLGWTCIGVAVAAVLVCLGWLVRTGRRQTSRRAGWLAVVTLAAIAVMVGLRSAPLAGLEAYVLAAALVTLPVAVAAIHLAQDFPPPGEVALHAVLGVAWVGAVMAGLFGVRAWADAIGLPDPTAAGAVAAVLIGVGLLPVVLGIRRAVLVRRYGSGRAPSRMLSELHTRLSHGSEPRVLLDIAAQVAADAVLSPSATITLGPDEPDPQPDSAELPLLIGGDRVGTLVVEPRRAGQPLERRDLAVLERLAVPVTLVARAVSLAVAVEHARQDERRRIMADLHDGLGPVLAGLSMRVTATRRMAQSDPAVAEALKAVGDGLTESRSEVRRIVNGLAPGRLVDGDLLGALADLIGTMRTLHGPTVELRVDAALAGALEPAVATAAYRTVAEGLTNAVRHANARTCEVEVRDVDENVLIEIRDDGLGIQAGAHPGAGLASLRNRATSLGGHLDVIDRPTGGTTLRAQLPKAAP